MAETQSKTVKRYPEGTRRWILEAATEQFGAFGLAGARVDVIAKAAETNERMLYYYFGSKEQFYVAVLESMYAEFAEKESSLNLSQLEPGDEIATLAKSIGAPLGHPDGGRSDQRRKLHRGRCLQTSGRLRATISPVIEVIDKILKRGAASGQYRANVATLDFYVTQVEMGYYIASNRFTIQTFTGRGYALQPQRENIVEMHLAKLEAYLHRTASVAGFHSPRARRL